MGKNLEFGNRIDRRLKHKSTVDGADIVGAVNQKVIGLRPLAIDGVGLVLPRRTSGFEQSGSQRDDARLKQSQLREVAAIERQVEDLALHHGLSQTADRVLHQICVRCHFDLLRLRPQLKMNADRRGLINIQRDSFLQIFLIALGLSPDLIMSDGQFNQDIRAVAIRSRRPR